ncbi:hypothetical protein [Methylobacterium sp. 285MFTsu5.1]|uniref:hypothetical protein n=1 Tax=Methylobacterium sp. 285MFTsu5.1 TaxID=1172187 RepID=UPI0003673D63|nr:hypothetical protein [Methylobacterium sp. 285MFTsu5.1]
MAGTAEKGVRGFRPSHRLTGSRAYACWARMKANANNPKAAGYPYVGERGLGYDPAWERFAAFHADMGDCPEGHTLRRRDHTQGYSKGNCVWMLLSDARKSPR